MDIKEWISAGKELGYKGQELREYAERKESEYLERSQRELREQVERRREEAALKKESEERQALIEREEDERKRVAHEREKEREERQAVIKREEDERKRAADEREIELLRMRLDAAAREGSRNEQGAQNRSLRPKLPKFDEQHDDMDQFLRRFEVFAQSAGGPEDTWTVNVSPLLTGMGLSVYTSMPASDINNYAALRKELLHRYELTEDGFRKRFREAESERGETVFQFVARITRYLNRWQDLAEVEKTYEGLNDLLVREQFISTCQSDMALFLKERRPKSIKEMTQLAQYYQDAHGGDITGTKMTKKGRPNGNVSQVKPRSLEVPRVSVGTKCFRCGKMGHLAKACRTKMAGAVANWRTDSFQSHRRREESPSDWRYKNNRSKEHVSKTAALCEGVRVNLESIKDCKNNGELKLADGRAVPIISGSVYLGPEKDKDYGKCVSKGYVGERLVQVLRDTGCTGAAVRRDLVKDDEMTGSDYSCILIDGTIRRFPLARIQVKTPYYEGQLTAMCMKEPVFDLVVGNVDGATLDPDIHWDKKPPVRASAVITRAQAQDDKQPIKPLRVVPDVLGQTDMSDLIDAQKEDTSLTRLRDMAKSREKVTTKGNGSYHFEIIKDVLHRIHETGKCDTSKTTKQIVVPSKFRIQIMTLAHEAIVGGHMGAKKTLDRITGNFHWPGITADVTRFCRSCDVCQKTIPKGRINPVPLGSMPLIEQPFSRVAIDLVGPISPVSGNKNRYILTIVDYATRYPEAVALKTIETERIAEALLEVFCRVGFPKEILSDRGSQFTSEVMKEICRLVSIKQLFTTPYNPKCNGLCERINGVLKSMLKKMCQERPVDWDRYLPAVLLAYREVPQSSTGFSPFEMLYGRTVRGPMKILKELWTKDDETDVRNSYQYILELRNRLEDTCRIARESLEKAQGRHKHHYDKRSRPRQFKVGQKVTVLLPTSHNKLLLQWKGPYEIQECMNKLDYKVKMGNKVKTLHANLPRAYVQRREESPTDDMAAVVAGVAVIEADLSEEVGVVEDDSLIHLGECSSVETYQDVNIHSALTDEQQEQIGQLLLEFEDIFTDEPGTTDIVEHSIELTTTEPIRVKPYNLPYAKRQEVEEEVQKMLKTGVIERANSEYNSPVVLVKKKGGSTRFCIDFRKLNAMTRFDTEPMGNTEDIMARLQKARYLTKIDLSKGYWQIPLRKESRTFTAFTTPSGSYQFLKMPFGLVNSGASFNRMMRVLLQNLEDVDHYIDDMLSHTETWHEHIGVLRVLFTRMRKAGLTARPSKCFIGYQAIEFLGHMVGKGSIAVDKEKVAKIQGASPPKTKKQVRSFLGLAGFYRKYIPNFSEIAVPLTDLTKKGQPNVVKWGDHQEKAFNRLKALLSKAPILRLPDFSRAFILQTNASDSGVGAALLQEFADGMFPIAYASKKLLPREQNYSVIERECLAIVFGVKQFQNFLYGREFMLYTDHGPLAYINKCKSDSSRLLRWALYLQTYKFRVVAIKGSENKVADYLSRQ